MKVLTTSLSVLAAMLITSTSHAATTGKVSFTGKVYNQTCDVSPATADQTVILSDVRASALDLAGKTANPTNFTLSLKGCTKGATVGFKFDQVNVDATTGTLNSSGTAQNVNVQILDRNSAPIALNAQTKADYVKVLANDIPIDYLYKAQYYATGEATPGTVSTYATFSIDYK